MSEISIIQSNPCNPNQECVGDLCPKSSTPICCKQCGSEDHINQIRENFKEISEDPELTHPAINEEMEAVIYQVQKYHKCRHVSIPCKGTRDFIISVPSPSS